MRGIVKSLRNSLILGVLAIATAAPGLSGCAQKRSTANWQHPTLPKAEWSADIGECRRHTRHEVEREAGLPASGPVSDNLPGGPVTYNRNMSSYELSRFQARTFDTCMERLGYTRIVK